MIVDTKQIVSITDANQNFSKATRIADENGIVVVFKNNRPKYKLINLEVEPDLELTSTRRSMWWPAALCNGSSLRFWSLRNDQVFKRKGFAAPSVDC